jgi:hypothetical protein
MPKKLIVAADIVSKAITVGPILPAGMSAATVVNTSLLKPIQAIRKTLSEPRGVKAARLAGPTNCGKRILEAQRELRWLSIS